MEVEGIKTNIPNHVNKPAGQGNFFVPKFSANFDEDFQQPQDPKRQLEDPYVLQKVKLVSFALRFSTNHHFVEMLRR